MKKKLLMAILLTCLVTGASVVRAQDYRHGHTPREERTFALSDEQFSVLYDKVKNASFDDRRMDLIEVASLGAYYTCGQCAALIDIFSFGNKKLAALRYMAPHIVDPRNAYLIYEKFSFTSEKDEAARLVGCPRPARHNH